MADNIELKQTNNITETPDTPDTPDTPETQLMNLKIII